jgi:hypothetical protein
VKVGERVSQVVIIMGKILSKLALSMVVFVLDVDAFFRDLGVVQAYVNDPLVFHRKTLTYLDAEFLAPMKRVAVKAKYITLHSLRFTVLRIAWLTRMIPRCFMMKNPAVRLPLRTPKWFAI